MTKNPTSRRDFLTVGSLGFLGLTLRDTLAAAAASPGAAAKANSVILFWLEGGPSHIDTFDPKPNSNFKPISTNVAGIQVSELLPKMAKVADKYTIVRSMTHNNNAHEVATYMMQTGSMPLPELVYPAMGAIVENLTDENARTLAVRLDFRLDAAMAERLKVDKPGTVLFYGRNGEALTKCREQMSAENFIEALPD